MSSIANSRHFLKLNGDGAMAGPLNMSNNKITHLAQATANGDAVDFEFFTKYTPTGSNFEV